MAKPGGEREGLTTLDLPQEYRQVGERESLGLEAGTGVLLLDLVGEVLLDPSRPAVNVLSD